MGVLKKLTEEYFENITREEEKIDISGLDVIVEPFTDNNGKFHKNGFRVLYDEDYDHMTKTLKKLIDRIIKKRGLECSLNDINVSNINRMFCYVGGLKDGLFESSNFNGDISGWNVQNVERMDFMFTYSGFTGQNGIFRLDKGNKVKNMESMFYYSTFDTNISDWKVKKSCKVDFMFHMSALKENGNLPQWYLERINN